MHVYSVIQGFLQKAITVEMIHPDDEIYVRNQMMALLAFDSFPDVVTSQTDQEIPELLDQLVDYAIEKGLIEDYLDAKEIFSSQLINLFIPSPSYVNKQFYQLYKQNPERSTTFFYQLSTNSNYIKKRDVAKNINYTVETTYGELDITINLSKPEKDPKQIAMEREIKFNSSNYPKCLLCVENEGYAGRIGHPARSNHRMIRLELKEEPWFFQYSPYVYYNEHCILLSGEHRDMKINRGTFARLLDFVDLFPHYFAGSNADLPIVGGSILNHDHYQGGNYEFAMARAKDDYVFTINSYPSIQAATVKWPMSVIRLRGTDKTELIDASDYILEKWKNHTDREVEIEAYTDETSHNTITPIARMKNRNYEVDLVLRNNRTSEEHPSGIFHPHLDVHHIKKENIGLIEVMGLAVLPPRLKTELEDVKKFILGEPQNLEATHLPWAEELKKQYGTKTTIDTVDEIVRQEVGKKFLKALEDAGVYKRDEAGQVAFRRFASIL
ncbi:UDP-glucose--hexose-1-phosphate uridylyltransferase [Bacillus sp. DJP31]|uniref:UDP-glucose--hexose-1-phosphate uridylyltransferase n=1 Tax=Bacillus sp. DJP31 TaxID=3409789 RepID=UPI003BB5F74C